MNSIEPTKAEFIVEDAGRYLRKCRDSRCSFDMIVLDPPKFAESKSHVQGASRAYKDINLLAIKLLNPDGGLLFTFSCSGHIDPDLFQKIVASAGMDAGRCVKILERLGQSADHPVDINFPEGLYLKGLLCHVSS